MADVTGWRGVIAIPQTPFLADGSVDVAGLTRGVEDRLESGAVALLTTAVASETGRLSPAERQRVVDIVLETVGGQVPVVVGTWSESVAASVALGTHAVRRGAAGLLVLPSPAITSSPRALRAQLERMRGCGAEVLMLQDLDWSGPGIPVPVLLDLIDEVDELRCVKVEVTPAGPKYSALLAATGGSVHVSGGWAATQLLEALDRGVHAVGAGGSHWAFARIIDLYDAGRRDEARVLFERLLPALAWSHQHIDLSNWMLKEVGVRQGLYGSSALRSPEVVLDAHHRRIGEELVVQLLDLDAEVRRGASASAVAAAAVGR